LILGICHTLLKESLHDINFLKKFTVGYEKFFQYLTGQSDGVIKIQIGLNTYLVSVLPR